LVEFEFVIVNEKPKATMNKDIYAVFGNPIQHSKSPAIHSYFAVNTQQNMLYGIEEPDVGNFKEAATSFFSNEYVKGANVTLPFKQDAFEFADNLTDRAKAAQAVNTLIKQPDGLILGDTTDGTGLVYDLTLQFGDLRNKHILIIGAGGAARGVIEPLFLAGVSAIHVANRTQEKAEFLVKQFGDIGNISASSLTKLPDNTFDIIVNSTSSSMTRERPPVPDSMFHKASIAYDMFYASDMTSFNLWAKGVNPKIKTSDGLGMLVGQALESFRLWRGVKPGDSDVLYLIEELKKELSV
jgi:shikimate dehydrogenase